MFFTANKEGTDEDRYTKFHQQFYHSSNSCILQLLKADVMKPEVVHFSDGHFRHTIYEFGPISADYPEKCLLSCIVQG